MSLFSLGRLPSRLRLLLARRPWIYWLVVAALAATVANSMVRMSQRVEHERASWGSTVTVAVVVREVAAGEAVAGAVVRRAYPTALVPATAVADVPAGAVAQHRISVGEVVVAADLARGAGPAALVPDGWLAVHLDTAADVFAVGDSVAVLADGQTIAPDGLVVGLDSAGLLVAVPMADAAAVADAATRGSVAVALSASPPPR